MPYIYDIGPCKRCGSLRTGEILPPAGLKSAQKEAKLAEKGIYVKYSGDYATYNTFCFDCGVKWYEFHKRIKVSKDELEEKCEMRKLSDVESAVLSARESDALTSFDEESAEETKKKRFGFAKRFLVGTLLSPVRAVTSVVGDFSDMAGRKYKEEDFEEESEEQ